MKISVVASGHIPSRWAHSINMVKHAHAFKQIGNDVELITVERWIDAKEKRDVGDIYEWYGIDPVTIKYIVDQSHNYFDEHSVFKWGVRAFNRITANYFSRRLDPEDRVSEYLRNSRFDLCYCRSFPTIVKNLKSDIPTILETHSWNPEDNPTLMEVFRLSQSDSLRGVVTIHERLKNIYARLGVPKNKIMVLDDAVDLEKFNEVRSSAEVNVLRQELSLPHDKFIVCYTGHLYKGRGVEYIVEAAQEARDVVFLIVGGHEKDLGHYKKFTSKLGLDNIIFTGHVANALIPKYCIAADCLLMPYTKDTPTWQHMSPIKMFEYMASFRPIIATNLPAITDILRNQENGLIIEEKNTKAIINAVRQLQNNRDLCCTMAENNRIKVEKYTYTNRCKKILDTFA